MTQTPSVYLHHHCRVCRGPLEEVLNLGPLALNTFPDSAIAAQQILKVPVILCVCTRCGLAQLDRTVPPDWLYRTYWYRSGVNESMVAELHQVVREAVARVPVGPASFVLDIGANDGTLLNQYGGGLLGSGVPQRFAVEPAANLAADLRARAEVVYHDYFPCAPLLRDFPGRFSIITAVACAYDVEDPLAFFDGIRRLLHPAGVAVVQFQDLGQQRAAAAFDNCCHEHLEYYTLWSLLGVVTQVGLAVEHVEPTPINGGSLRVFLRHQGRRWPCQDSVRTQLMAEAAWGLDTPTLRQGNLAAFATFRARVQRVQRQIQAVVQPVLDAGRVLDIYGASTKGNILLQVLSIGPQHARQAIDRAPQKTGYYTLTGIPIVGEEAGRTDPADVWLCPIWQFRESVLRREAWFVQQGGTIIFPLPRVEIVRQGWGAPQA